MSDDADKDGSSKCPDHLKPYWWKKGQSGNPKGRPKGSGKILKSLQDAFAEDDNRLVKLAVEKYMDILFGDDANVSLKAFVEGLNRMDGTPIKRLEITEVEHKKLVSLDDDDDDDEESGEDEKGETDDGQA